MNKNQLEQILNYLDNEFAGIVNKMSEAERKSRAQHWAKEIGFLDFGTVMMCVRKLSRGQYMPRTAEVLMEIEKMQSVTESGKAMCKIYTDASGNEIVNLTYSDGSEFMTGYISVLPEWLQIKLRWMANPTPENTAAWDEFILAYETRQ